MSVLKRKTISVICIIALVVSLVGMMPVDKSYGATMVKIELDGTCQTGYVDDGAAYYYFETPVNGTTRVGVSSGCSSISMTISKTPSFSNVIYTGKDTTENLPAGKYYVEVDCDAGHDCTDSFEISANFKALNEYDAEPNNTMDTAITMTSGTTYKGHVYSSYNDVDWYKLVVKDRSIVHFYLNNVSDAHAFIFDQNGDWVTNFNGCAPGLTYPMYGVEPGTYYIKIQPAYAVDRNYEFSARVVEYPTIPTIKSVTATGMGKAKITWTKSKYAEGYWLFKENVSTGSWTRVATLSAGTLSYTDYNAPYPGYSTIYHICGYRYDPKDPYNPSLEILSHETDEGTKYKGKVPTPTDVDVKKYSSYIKVSWDKVAGATGYKVYRKANGGDYSLIKTVKGDSTLSLKNTSVKKGVNYTYKVKAYYKDYNGKYYYSNSSSTAKTKMTGSISAPSSVTAKKYSSYNKVTWKKVNNVVGYKVYRKVGSGSYKLVKTTTSTSFKDKSVKSGRKYTYKVKAYYKNYTYSSSKGKYTYKVVNSKYSKTSTVRR